MIYWRKRDKSVSILSDVYNLEYIQAKTGCCFILWMQQIVIAEITSKLHCRFLIQCTALIMIIIIAIKSIIKGD